MASPLPTRASAAQTAPIGEIARGDGRFTTLVAAAARQANQNASESGKQGPVADIMADSGVIRVIDNVLRPGTRPDCHPATDGPQATDGR
jgi:hypothetical protein